MASGRKADRSPISLRWLADLIFKTFEETHPADDGDRPWLERLIWLGTSSYSLSAEAMALNNLGAAELALGEVDAARAHLNRAIAKDPNCPLPYRNMGLLVLSTGLADDAQPWLEKAIALGLRGDWSDRAARASQRNNAELTTTGTINRYR